MFNKKVLQQAIKDLDKAKEPAKSKDIIVDPAGQWKFPGQPTRIPSNTITMEGVDYPVLGIPNYGEPKVMMPGQYYEFPEADYVDEYPEFRKGGIIPKYNKLPKNYGKAKYSSNISATNKVFARNILFRNERNKIYDPKARYQDGGVSPIEGDLISKVLMNRNRGVDFVDRAYALGDNPGTPLFNVPDDEEFGNHMSHKMAWGTDDQGQAYMFPTVLNPNDEAIKVPNQYADYISSEGYKNATGMNYQDDGEYVELDLTPKEIQEYAKGGYIVEDISIPSLTKAQFGLFKKKDKQDPNKLEYREPVKVEDDLVESVTPFPEAPEDFKKGVANLKEVEAGPYWLGISREYSGKHNKQAYIDKKKRQYLRNTNRGLAKAAGLSMENFPKDVEKNFINEYNYKRNNYVVKNLFKNAGISPNKREEWVDKISDADRALIANSKYGNKLKPSIWARTLAGLGTMASKFSPEIADAMERGDLPGLTREEQRAIKNAKIKGIPVGGVEALAGTDAIGVALANAVEASGNGSYGGDYKEAPGLLSGDVMPKITDDQIAVLNPFTYTVGYDVAPLAKGLLKGATKIGKAAARTTGKVLTEATPLKNAYKLNKAAIKESAVGPGFSDTKNLQGATVLKQIKAVPVESGIKRALGNITTIAKEAGKDIMYQIDNYSNIKNTPKIYKEEVAKLLTDKGKERLKGLGVEDIDDFMNYINRGKSYTTRGAGTHAGEMVDYKNVSYPSMNIDFEQLNKLKGSGKLTDKEIKFIASHELGHNIQSYLESIGKTYKGRSYLDIEAVDELAPFIKEKPKEYLEKSRMMNDAEAENLAKKLGDDDDEILNASYFIRGSKGNEPLPHLRELKQRMLNKGVITNIHDNITAKDIGNFYINHKGYKDRILSFIKPGDDAYKTLAKLLNKTPVVIPAAIGAGALQQEKDGGVVSELSQKEIDKLVAQGYIVETVD